MQLYVLSNGPPSLAVRQAIKFLDIPCDVITMDYAKGDHTKEEYIKKNPQREIPLLIDEGFCLGESNAILQYICDKFKPDCSLYPKDPKVRAIINHRLCFNLSTYYRFINEYSMDPIFFDFERTPLGLKKTHIALNILNTYLKTLGKKYAAADHVTIADFPLVDATMCLESVNFDFSAYTHVVKWYKTFKQEYPDLWTIAAEAMAELSYCEKNLPNLSHLEHPYHPYRKFN